MIRKAILQDAKAIQDLIKQYASSDIMLARSLNDIYENIRDFSVCEDESGNVIACSALHIIWEDLAEVRSLAVSEENKGRGIGKQLVEFEIKEAHKLGVEKVFALTYQDKFFQKLGFKVIDKEKLPHKIWSDCIKCVKFPDCDEIAMIYKTEDQRPKTEDF